jgi:hypothetical protein
MCVTINLVALLFDINSSWVAEQSGVVSPASKHWQVLFSEQMPRPAQLEGQV